MALAALEGLLFLLVRLLLFMQVTLDKASLIYYRRVIEEVLEVRLGGNAVELIVASVRKRGGGLW